MPIQLADFAAVGCSGRCVLAGFFLAYFYNFTAFSEFPFPDGIATRWGLGGNCSVQTAGAAGEILDLVKPKS